MTTPQAKLKELKAQLSKITSEKDQTEGRLASLYEQMEEMFKVTTLKGAEVKLAKLRAQAKTITASIEKGVAELEKTHELGF